MTGPSAQTPTPAPRPYGAPEPPQPGVVPLRPLRAGEILGGAIATIRRYPGPMLGIAALVMAVVEAVEVPATYAVLTGGRDETTAYAAVVAVLGGVSYLLLTGVATAVVGQAVLGRPITVGAVWNHLRPVLGSLAAVTAVVFLVPAVVVAAAVVPVAWLTDPTAGSVSTVAVVAIAAAVAIAAYLFILWSFAPAAVVLERQGAGAALRRSQMLVRGSWWRVFGVIVLAQVLAALVAGIVSAPFSGGGDLLDPGTDVTFGTVAVRGIGGFVAGVLVRPFTAGVTALLYIDRRMRVESLDTTLQAAAEGQ